MTRLRQLLLPSRLCRCLRWLGERHSSGHLTEPAVQDYFNRAEVEALGPSAPRTTSAALFTARRDLLTNLAALTSLESDKSSADLSEMIAEERAKYSAELADVETKLLLSLSPPAETGNDVVVEITAGVGGKEAALFSKELFDMYCQYANYKNWNSIVDEADTSELGGIRHARIYVEGEGALERLRAESGIHRVQRVPSTEKSGRIHTSTSAVAVLRQLPLVDIHIADKDLIVETMRATGAGGQHVNKTDSAVRLTHVPSGLVVECQEDRSQIKNRQIAIRKLKMRLNDRAQQERDSQTRSTRKSQIGTSARSDKVRTYNYPQDRITDHRLSQSIHNLPGFFKGEQLLDSTIDKLVALFENERLGAFVQLIKDNKV